MKMHDKQEQGNATPGQLFQTLTTGTETVRFHGIPFSVTRKEDGAVATLPVSWGNPSGWDNDLLPVQGSFSALFSPGCGGVTRSYGQTLTPASAGMMACVSSA